MEIINSLPHYIGEFFNIPGVQIAISILSLVYGAIRIIASTSIGKKALKDLTDKFNKSESNYKAILEKEEELIKAKDSQISELQAFYEEKYGELINNTQNEIKCLKTALSKINNEQVKKVLADYENDKSVEK